MKKQGCLEKLKKLFDEHLDQLVEVCIYNIHDLLRCIAILPSYSDNVIESILSNPAYVERLFGTDNEQNLREKLKKYPREIRSIVIMPDSKQENHKLKEGQMGIRPVEKESLLYSFIVPAEQVERNKPITKLELKGQLGNKYTSFVEALKIKDEKRLQPFLSDILTIASKQGITLSHCFEEFFEKNDKTRALLDAALPESITDIVVGYRGYSRGRRSVP